MKVLVLMSGGFHPFHPGHLALYNSAKQAFPGADIVIGATNVQKDRPFSFKDKATLATIAGVDRGHFVEVNRQFSVKGEPNIEGRIQDADDTILIFVRSEKDAGDPALQPWKLNPDGSIPMTKGSKNHPPRPTSNYLLPYAGNQKKLQPMTKHAYIAFLPVQEFGPADMTSATQIRNAWPTLNDKRKQAFAMSLYPATQQNSKLLATVVDILDRNLGSTSEPVVEPEKSAIKKLKADKLKEHIQRMRPLMSEASVEQKLKLLKLMKVALNESMTENDTAAGINKMFNNLGDPVFSNLQRVALLAMQGRQNEADSRLQTVIKDADPAVQKKIVDAVNSIKPVTLNGRIADSSTLDKSKQHNDWIINTFIPWVQSLLGQNVSEGALPWTGKAVVVSDENNEKILDTLDIETAAQKYGLNPDDIRKQLQVQTYTVLQGPKGKFMVSHPMAPTALDAVNPPMHEESTDYLEEK